MSDVHSSRTVNDLPTSGIKRFHVRDGYVLDEDENGSVVRYDHHIAIVAALEAELDRLRAAIERVRR